MNEVSAKWGHALLTPSIGPTAAYQPHEIRVPAWAFPGLRRLGLLERNRSQLSPLFWAFARDHDVARLEPVLFNLLGVDATGPAWCVCKCVECQRNHADGDNTRTEREEIDRIVGEIRARRKVS